mmetsp:Transcript_7836/g.30948  ORF Transcript_7836/g.30948 Transcript_7836/m.30948 type:complete len:330 (+) Transcript_7836:2499-3488(+)
MGRRSPSDDASGGNAVSLNLTRLLLAASRRAACSSPAAATDGPSHPSRSEESDTALACGSSAAGAGACKSGAAAAASPAPLAAAAAPPLRAVSASARRLAPHAGTGASWGVPKPADGSGPAAWAADSAAAPDPASADAPLSGAGSLDQPHPESWAGRASCWPGDCSSGAAATSSSASLAEEASRASVSGVARLPTPASLSLSPGSPAQGAAAGAPCSGAATGQGAASSCSPLSGAAQPSVDDKSPHPPPHPSPDIGAPGAWRAQVRAACAQVFRRAEPCQTRTASHLLPTAPRALPGVYAQLYRRAVRAMRSVSGRAAAQVQEVEMQNV